jgi:hypothetical protein
MYSFYFLGRSLSLILFRFQQLQTAVISTHKSETCGSRENFTVPLLILSINSYFSYSRYYFDLLSSNISLPLFPN